MNTLDSRPFGWVGMACLLWLGMAKPLSAAEPHKIVLTSTNGTVPPLIYRPLPSPVLTNAIPPAGTVYLGDTNKPLAPGIYKSVPYTCIVKVPEGHLDELFVKTIPESTSTMRIIRPPGDLVPLNAPSPTK